LTKFRPIRFIGEPIEVYFNHPPLLEKKQGAPDRFTWKGETYPVVELLSEWHDYQRRGRMARNISPTHAQTAVLRGSWGVGQDYYRVRIVGGRIFDLYYDRAPQDASHRKGAWFLDKELADTPPLP